MFLVSESFRRIWIGLLTISYSIYLLILGNGKIIKIEKNARITITQIHSIDTNSNNDYNISLPNITLNEFVNNGYKEMKENFFIYNAHVSNCQHFILGLLKGSNSLTPEAAEFIKQKTENIFQNMSQTQAMMNRITDLER